MPRNFAPSDVPFEKASVLEQRRRLEAALEWLEGRGIDTNQILQELPQIKLPFQIDSERLAAKTLDRG